MSQLGLIIIIIIDLNTTNSLKKKKNDFSSLLSHVVVFNSVKFFHQSEYRMGTAESVDN